MDAPEFVWFISDSSCKRPPKSAIDFIDSKFLIMIT